MGVDDVELVLAKPAKLSPERRIGDRVTLAPRRFEGTKSNCVWVRFLVSGETGSEDVDEVAFVSKLPNEQINANADAIADRENAVGEDGNA